MNFSRSLYEPAISILASTPRTDCSVSPRSVIRPHDHLATITAARGICFYAGSGTKVSHLGIRNTRVITLVIPPNAHCATRKGARHINGRLVHHRHAVAQHVHRAALGACRNDLACAFYKGITGGLKHDLPAFKGGSCRLDQTAVFQGTGKNTHRIALQRA